MNEKMYNDLKLFIDREIKRRRYHSLFEAGDIINDLFLAHPDYILEEYKKEVPKQLNKEESEERNFSNSPEKKFPCIYFFDAHARGSLPVRTYKDLAEKYGFVLIGSNISKNGTEWQVTNDGVKVLMEDTRSRINIDPKRIYTSGFSGGLGMQV